MAGVKFIWDERKNLINIRKHRFDLARAVPAFSGPLRKEYYDDKHSSLVEERFLFAGYAENAVLLVSFTEPDPETIRLISARKAEKYEVEVYYNGNNELHS
jgi:uncharacterized DUF497 family protein